MTTPPSPTQPRTAVDNVAPRWRTRQVLVFLLPLFLYLAFPLGFWPCQIGANSSAHVYLAMALYFRGEACVDEEVRDYNYNHDLIFKNGHYYSNKPPGPALWLLPAAAAIDVVSSGQLELIPLLYFGRVLMLTLMFVVFLYFLGRSLERLAHPAVAWGLTLAYALGTNAGVYATLYLSHDLAAMGLVTGFLVLLRASPRWCWLGGMATGFAVVCEYQTVGVAVVLAVFSCFVGRRRFDWRTALSFGLGAVPMAALLLIYNYTLSGALTELAYQTEFKHFELTTTQTLGFTGPGAAKLVQMAFSPGVGLFFFSPWLLLVFPAAVVSLVRRSPERRLLIASLAAALVLVLTIASHEYWVGGAISGPRYLTAGLPFFLFPIACLVNRVRGPWRTVTVVGLLATLTVAIATFAALLLIAPHVNTEPDALDLNPISSYLLPLLGRKLATLTVANVLGAGFWLSLGIHLLLLLTALVGFLIPWFRGATGRARATALASLLLGGLLCAVWVRLGTSESAYSRYHVDRSTRVMHLDRQPRDSGRIRFIRRVRAVDPPRRFHAAIRSLHPKSIEVLPESLEVEELARDFKSLFTLVGLPDGSVLLSDIVNNTMHRYTSTGELLLVVDGAGCIGANVVHWTAPGVSGVAADSENRFIITQNGWRQISRIERDGSVTILSTHHGDKRFNSPRGPVVRSDGTIFFTDPPFGLNSRADDTARELNFSGIYRWRRGELTLVSRELEGPGALAFSPDERHLFATNWSPGATRVVRFDVDAAGSLSNHTEICLINESPRLIPTAGLCVDRLGHLYVTADMRLWILSPQGVGLALLEFPTPINGLAWGGDDLRTLYLAGQSRLYRMRMKVPGHRP